MTGAAFAALLEAQGYDFFTGVPCSMISGLIATLETHPRLPYVPAVREDVAVGLAAGAWLAGRQPMVLMQNSGLGTSLNALVSLSLMYRLPALLLVTWRGHAGKDAPEHLLMGEISPSLLDMIRIPHRVLSAKTIADDIAWGRRESERLSQPVALLLPPGILDNAPHAAAAPAWATAGPPAPRSALDDPIPTPRISRFEALRAAVSALTSEPVVHANGYICRESFAVKDRTENFYMIGSMGMASAIGLGVALAAPARPTVVFDGDGNLLMSLGILPMIGGGPVMGRGRPGQPDARGVRQRALRLHRQPGVALARGRPPPHRAGRRLRARHRGRGRRRAARRRRRRGGRRRAELHPRARDRRGAAGAPHPLLPGRDPRSLPRLLRSAGGSMKAIILVAGVARRLAPLTDSTHKALLPVGGRSLLDRMLDGLAACGVEESVLVVGHCQDQVRRAAGGSRGAMRISYVENPAYQKGSILSLWCARETMLKDSTLIMDADVLFPERFLTRLIAAPAPSALLLDRGFQDTGEEVKLYAVGDRVIALGKKFVPEAWDVIGEGVGFFKCGAAHAPEYIRLLEESIQETGGANEYEDALHRLLARVPVGWVDVTGLPWTEVDFAEDLRRAETQILPKIESLGR